MDLKRAIEGFLLSLVFFLFFLDMIFGLQWFFDNSISVPEGQTFLGSISSAQSLSANVEAEIKFEIAASLLPPPEISAASAISVESDLQNANRTVFEKNSNTQLPIASITKLMTAIIVLDNYNLSDIIAVSAAADLQDPLRQDVKLGDAMAVENFLNMMLISSSNKAAYALAEPIGIDRFVGLMNMKSKGLGLQNTFFADPTGLSDQDVSTANDLIKLTEYILKNYPKIAEISKAKELYIPGFGTIINTDQLLTEIPDIICGKTGFTSAAKGCLLLVVNSPRNNNYLINVILGAEDRFSEMKKLVNWSNEVCN